MLEIRGIWLCHMSRWDRYVLRPRIWVETPRSGTVPHIGPYTSGGHGGARVRGHPLVRTRGVGQEGHAATKRCAARGHGEHGGGRNTHTLRTATRGTDLGARRGE